MGDFSVDLQKAYAIRLKGRTSLARKLRYWISDSELHCLACYRFGEFADDLRSRHRFAGLVMVAVHRIWNRRVTHIDHCDISHSARIGPGLLLMHRHGVIIGPVAIGKNCVIHQGVTIGERVAGGDHGVPSIGDDVWIGPGAIITGNITVGDGATISAGTVLSRDVAARCLVGGNPGRVLVNGYDNSAILNYRVG